jgi:hypothetical protein
VSACGSTSVSKTTTTFKKEQLNSPWIDANPKQQDECNQCNLPGLSTRMVSVLSSLTCRTHDMRAWSAESWMLFRHHLGAGLSQQTAIELQHDGFDELSIRSARRVLPSQAVQCQLDMLPRAACSLTFCNSVASTTHAC